MAQDKGGASPLSGLTADEAREFHGIFMRSTVAFALIALVAHILVWQWRPWFPGPQGYTTSQVEQLHTVGAASTILS